MNIYPAGVALLKEFEGCVLHAYQDRGGKWTIGWGHTGADVVPQSHWLQAQADAVLLTDLRLRVAAVNHWAKMVLAQNQFDALVDLVYNIGAANFATSTLLRLLNAADYYGASQQFVRWNKVRVDGELVVTPGLTRRRLREAQLFQTP